MKMSKGFTLIELMIVIAIIGILAAVAIPLFVPQDRVTNVMWMSDGEIAVVSYENAENKKDVFRIRCKENVIRTPFNYSWEDDCDLNIELNGFVYDYDNPEDDRFEVKHYDEAVNDVVNEVVALAIIATANTNDVVKSKQISVDDGKSRNRTNRPVRPTREERK